MCNFAYNSGIIAVLTYVKFENNPYNPNTEKEEYDSWCAGFLHEQGKLKIQNIKDPYQLWKQGI